MPNYERGEGTPDPTKKTEGSFNPDDQVRKLLDEGGLFGAPPPPGTEPTCFPIKTMDSLQYGIARSSYREAHGSAHAQELAAWKSSIRRIQMAYEIIAFPILGIAGERFARDPARNPEEYGPLSYETAVEEKIRDAQEHPEINIQEFPHRGPVTLSEGELAILGKITEARGLPFNPEKRVYRYTEHVALLDARYAEVMRKFGGIVESNAVEKGILRDREEIEKEMRERLAKWQRRDPNAPPQDETPKKPRT